MNKHKSQQFDYEIAVPIKGMHCASCELLIAGELEEIQGVTSVKADLKTNSATIRSSTRISDADINAAVEAAGYTVGEETVTKPLITRDNRVWKDAVIGVWVVLGLYILFKLLGIDQLAASTPSSGSNGTMALVVGLTAGFSTCMALIGGLVLSVASKYAENHPTESTLQKFRPHLFFNLGRIVSFVLLGGAIGLIGSAFAISSTFLGLLTIAVGIVMLLLGLQLTGIFPRLTKGFTLPSGLAKKLGINNRKDREYSHTHAFMMGAVTFFLPCGFTQAMQLLAVSTGDPVQAAIIMGAFAIGTTPGLLSLGGITSIVKGIFAQRFFRIVGIVVVAMAFINVANGLNLSGISQSIENFELPQASQKQEQALAQSLEGSTILNTTYTLREDIIPSTFTAKVGQRTTLLVDVKDNGQGCMSTIMIIGLDNRPQYLAKGEKIAITFTAKKPGTYKIACAMGVPRGSITVTE